MDTKIKQLSLINGEKEDKLKFYVAFSYLFIRPLFKSKLFDMKEKERQEKISDLKGEQKEIAWGSQIRSYVFCPYTLVKDHRTNYEVGNVNAVMDGDLDDFMEEYLKQYNTK